MAAASRSYAPDAQGTLLPDNTRWGPYKGAEVFDDTGLLASSEVDLVASGFRWTEGPTWIPDSKSLYFSDVIDARICRWNADVGVAVNTPVSGGYNGSNVENYESLFEPGSNGMAFHDGWMYVCQHATRRLVRVRLCDFIPGKQFYELAFEVVADTAPNGRRFNSPNDVIVAPNGDVFFTDPMYGFLQKQPAELGFAFLNAEAENAHPDQPYLEEAMRSQGVGFTGVYRVRNGCVELVTSLLSRPNGLAFSPDESLLWVANSDKNEPSWTAFRVTESVPWEQVELLNSVTLGCDLTKHPSTGASLPGLSDGFKIDALGQIWSSVMGGVCVLDPVAKRVLARIIFGINTSNLCFGDDGDVFVTGLGHIWRLKRRAT
jgi:gluconolactonase